MTFTRYITPGDPDASPDSTPEPGQNDPERFRIYRLCQCSECGGSGKTDGRCKTCRGEGRTLDLVATCGTPEAIGVTLVTLASEGEFDECPIGIMDRPDGQTGKWLVKPWLPSARNVSDAGRLLRAQR